MSRVIGGPGWIELAALWILMTSTLTLIVARLGRTTTGTAPTLSSVSASTAVAASLALVGVGCVAWSWARNGGRPAQRLSRQAWRTGRLPEQVGLQIAALGDLQRRRRLLLRRGPQIVVTLVWPLISAIQIAIDHSPWNIAVWAVILGSFLVSGIRDGLDRHRLPRLDALLGGSTTGAGRSFSARSAP